MLPIEIPPLESTFRLLQLPAPLPKGEKRPGSEPLVGLHHRGRMTSAP